MSKLKFKCPKCNGNRLEEVCTQVVQSSEITDIDAENELLDYGGTSYDGGELSHYQCLECSYVLIDEDVAVETVEDLIAWLKENCPQDKE